MYLCDTHTFPDLYINQSIFCFTGALFELQKMPANVNPTIANVQSVHGVIRTADPKAFGCSRMLDIQKKIVANDLQMTTAAERNMGSDGQAMGRRIRLGR